MNKQLEACRLAAAGEYAQAAALGAEALREADLEATRAAGIVRDIVAFSLFGDNPAYCETAVLNATLMQNVYPDWEMWVVHDASVPDKVLRRLAEWGVQLATAEQRSIAHWPGTFWRFIALEIPGARRVLFRDADSLICDRERRLVEGWIAGGKPFHVMRDWHSHVDLILAGLWGAYAPFLANIRELVEAYIRDAALHPTHADQHFLAASVWPRIRDFALVHDSVHTGLGATSFEPAPLSPEGKHALGAYLMKSLKFTSRHNGKYVFRIVDGKGEEVCAYAREFVDGQSEVEIPYFHYDRIRFGEWKCEIDVGAAKPVPHGI